MPDKALALIGAGGHACVVAEAAMLTGWRIVGHVAPAAGDDPVLGAWLGGDDALGDLRNQGVKIALGLGFVNAAGAERRAAILDGIDPEILATILHPRAWVSPSARLGPGGFVAAGGIVGTGAVAGCGLLLNTGAIMDHHTIIGSNCHIATGARLTGAVTVGDDVLIGAGSVVRQGLGIGAGAILGAGCVAVSDVPEGAVWGGNPGRALR